MEERRFFMRVQDIKAGDIYRHFQGNLYQIVTVGKHAETLEEYVVYQALYGDFQVYLRDIQDFLKKLDNEKYSGVQQQYRFERVEKEELNVEKKVDVSITQNNKKSETPDIEENPTSNIDTFMERSNNKEGMQMFMKFLDAETCKEKLEIFLKMRKKLDERLITNVAVSLDLVVDEKDIEESCQIIIKNLEQRSKFECFRLR